MSKEEILPSGTWGLRSPWAKRLFLVGLAALAARNESGSTDPKCCRDLAGIFGAEPDFEFFLNARTNFGKLIRGMNNEDLVRAAQDALQFEDTDLGTKLSYIAKKRGLEIKTTAAVNGSKPLKRKFSFDD